MSTSPILVREFLFLRHGETDWNRARRCVGQVDRPLSDVGRAQALAARRSIHNYGPTTIFCSPLVRAVETAMIVATGLECRLMKVEALKEACLGIREGAAEDDPADDFIGQWLDGEEIEGAESYERFRARVVEGFAGIAGAGGERPVIVAHWAVNHALTTSLRLEPIDIPHCEPWRYRRTGSSWDLELLG